jgi:hypothetical protein
MDQSREQLAQVLKTHRSNRSGLTSRYSQSSTIYTNLDASLQKQKEILQSLVFFFDIIEAAASRPFSLPQSLLSGASEVPFLLSQ